MLVNFLQAFQREVGGGGPGWRPASHLLSWLYKLEVAQELQVTFQRVGTEAEESVVAFWVHTRTYSLSLTEFRVAGF